MFDIDLNSNSLNRSGNYDVEFKFIKDSLCFGWKMLPKQSRRTTRKNGFGWFKIQTSLSFTRTNFSSSSSSRPKWYLLCLQGKSNTNCIICILEIKGNDITWYAPSSLKELAKLKSDFPDAKLITGNTECRLEQKFRKIEYAKQIYTRGIKEICQINVTDDFIEIGSGIEFLRFHRPVIDSPPENLRPWKLPWILRKLKKAVTINEIKEFMEKRFENVSLL